MSATKPVSDPGDRLARCVSSEAGLSLRAISATGMVGEAALRHGTSPTASAALGRALMACSLLASGGKDGETVQLQFRGDGPGGTLTAISDELGRARGYLSRPAAHVPSRTDGKLDVGGLIGEGLLAVVRFRPGWRSPYSGIVPLVSGEIAEDVARYLAESEQVPSAMALGVFVGSDATVHAAGGFLVQALPGARPDALDTLERALRDLPPASSMVRGGLDARGILERVAGDLPTGPIVESRPRFHCACDLDRVLRAVALLGREETRQIARDRETVDVRCEFCGDSYALDPDAVGALHADA